MNTTRALNDNTQCGGRGRPALGFSGKVRAFFREQQDAQELLLDKQAPWLRRR